MTDALKVLLISLVNWGIGILSNIPNDIVTIIDAPYIDDLDSVVLGIMSALIPLGISMMVLFFVIDFANKAMNPDWITFPNVVTFFIKAIVFKIIITESATVLGYVYSISTSIFSAIGGIPSVGIFDSSGITTQISNIDNGIGGILTIILYLIAVIALTALVAFSLIYVRIILFGRIVSIMLHRAIAPIALSTLASENNSMIGRRFIQSYGALCLQSAIILLSSIIVSALSVDILGAAGLDTWEGLLGYTVVICCYMSVLGKSESIARSILGL